MGVVDREGDLVPISKPEIGKEFQKGIDVALGHRFRY